MLNVWCPETRQETTEHVTSHWRSLTPETPVVAEVVQQSPKGAGKEPLLSSLEFSVALPEGTNPLSWTQPQDFLLVVKTIFRSGSLLAIECYKLFPSLYEGAHGSHTLFWASRLRGAGQCWDWVADSPNTRARCGRNLLKAFSRFFASLRSDLYERQSDMPAEPLWCAGQHQHDLLHETLSLQV